MESQLYNNELNRTWSEEFKSYIFWVLGGPLLFILFDATVILTTDVTWNTLLRKNALVFYFELVFIPMFTVAVIFLVKQKLGHLCRTSSQFISLKVIAMIIGVILSTGMSEIIAHQLGVIDDDYMGIGSFQLSPVMTNFVTNVLISFVVGLPIFLRQSSEERGAMKLLEKERELSKAYELKIKSELDAIHAKINPHFLYNALNSIVSLIHENPNKAEKMVLSLSDLFRYSISSKDGNFSTVKKEMELVSTYLEIEQVRFQDQLKVDVDVQQEAHDQMIPRFLIQPLIENAIKHGTSKITNGEIRLSIQFSNEVLTIIVHDNGPKFPDNIDSGYGLKSTVDKLNLLYGDNGYHFKILNEPEKRIQIDLQTNKMRHDEV